jgi:hypothetical protein
MGSAMPLAGDDVAFPDESIAPPDRGDVPSVVEIQRRLPVILRDVRHWLPKSESLIACS